MKYKMTDDMSDVKEVKSKSRSSAKASAKPEVVIPHALTVKELADLIGINPIETVKHLMRIGIMANVNQVVDFEQAAMVATNVGFKVKETQQARRKLAIKKHVIEEESEFQKPRPPVVTIMGHVDHGKTKLLDAIRKANVVDTEAGNITQHIGAYQVEIDDQKITFLDTPGHEAFTAMRARGAQVTDIAVLVVAADDGVMPQTVEAMDHAKAADVPIVVAINKIDKEAINIERLKKQLADNGLLIEEWGGDVIAVPVSAKRGDGIEDLLENILLVAEIQELKANPARPAIGVVVEAKMDKSKGALATVLIQTGTLRLGDNIVVGEHWGKVKAMFDDKGKRVKKAEPAMPVEVLGLSNIPQVGDVLAVYSSEKKVRLKAEQKRKEREALGKDMSTRLSNVYAQIKAGQFKELSIVLKTDVQGSLEPIRNSLERISTDTVKVRIVHSGSGNITENDVTLAVASKGIVIGFNTGVETGAKLLAEVHGVDIRNYQVIYDLIDDIEKALAGMLEPVYVDAVEGHAEVRAVFKVKQGKIAGAYITDGKVARGSLARVLRKGEIIADSSVSSLKHFKDDVKELTSGFECGIGIANFANLQEGDVIEVYKKEQR